MTDGQNRPDPSQARVVRDVDAAPDEAFAQFVVDSASILVGVARLVTGDPMRAAVAVDEAWPEVYRRWPRIAAAPSPLAAALAVFVAAAERSAEPGTPQPARGLELRDGGLVDAVTVLGHEPLEPSIGEALLDLPTRARAALALRWHAGLTDADLVRATRGRLWRPVRVADAAFADVRHTSTGAAGRSQAPPEREPEREFTRRLARELAERAGPAVDGDAELVRIRGALSGIRPLRPRRQVPRLGLAAAAAVLVTTAVAGLALSTGSSGGSGGSADSPGSPPTAVDGSQLVGFQTVYAAVPGSWTHNRIRCGTVYEDTVVYPDAIGGCDGTQSTPAVPPSSVTFSVPPSSPIPLGRLRLINAVGGDQVFGTTPIKRHGLLQQVVVIPQAGVQMMVRTPDPQVLDAIVDSLRAVPPGYVVVPACTRLPLRDAIGRLTAVGLNVRLTQASTLNMHYGAPPVTHQSIATGQIVARGTVVGLGFPSTN